MMFLYKVKNATHFLKDKTKVKCVGIYIITTNVKSKECQLNKTLIKNDKIKEIYYLLDHEAKAIS